MRLLLLGGTGFLGRHIVDAALAAGHDLTLFVRGRTNPALFPTVERIYGDRTADVSALAGCHWDAVIDTCGYQPARVRESARVLAGGTRAYVFVSSVSAYATFDVDLVTEDTPVAVPDDHSAIVSPETYGPLKAACEAEVLAAFGEAALVVRPGLIAGPHDPTGRFTYWPVRVADGGDVLVPGRPDRPAQVIDARDLAAWLVGAVEREVAGVFNAVAPAVTMAAVLDACAAAAGTPAQPVWVDDAFLGEHDVVPWLELPLWIPDDPQTRGLCSVSLDRAASAGLAPRPLEDTARDVLAWARAAGPSAVAGTLTREKERRLLDEWGRR